MLMASLLPDRVLAHLPPAPQFANMPPKAPGYFHPQFPNQPNRPVPLPFKAATCCDDCSCGSSGGCPDCASSGRGSLSMAGFFSGLGDGDTTNIVCPSGQVPFNANTTGWGADAWGCVNASSGGGGSSSWLDAGSKFVSNLATNLLKPTAKPGMVVAAPWYTTPVGFGALAIGAVAVYMLLKKD
jgi:hypothetical protein